MTISRPTIRTADPDRTGSRLAPLDGLRALAALAVVLLHVSGATGADRATVAGDFLRHGDVGVPIFFALSGFLLYSGFAAAHRAERTATPAGGFWYRRGVRVMPAYWLALAFAVAVFHSTVTDSVGALVRHALLLDPYSSRWALTGMEQTWSLTAEVAFYLLLPLYAAAVGALAARTGWLRTELVAAALLLVAGLGIHWWLAATRPSGTVAAVWLPAQLQHFAVGILLAVLAVAAADRSRTVPVRAAQAAARHPGACWLVAGGAFTLVALTVSPEIEGLWVQLSTGQAVAQQVLYALVAAALLLPLAVEPGGGGAIRGVLGHRWAAFLGLVSYGVFLWHLDWIRQLEEWGAFDWVPEARFLTVTALTLALSLGCAVLSWRLLEEPLRRSVRRRHRRHLEVLR